MSWGKAGLRLDKMFILRVPVIRRNSAGETVAGNDGKCDVMKLHAVVLPK